MTEETSMAKHRLWSEEDKSRGRSGGTWRTGRRRYARTRGLRRHRGLGRTLRTTFRVVSRLGLGRVTSVLLLTLALHFGK